jgi:chromosomal replication initiator protein
MIAMYLSRTMTMCSLPTIARAFNGRDHTCPLYAFRKIKAQREIDGNLDSTIEAIKSLILTGK